MNEWMNEWTNEKYMKDWNSAYIFVEINDWLIELIHLRCTEQLCCFYIRILEFSHCINFWFWINTYAF